MHSAVRNSFWTCQSEGARASCELVGTVATSQCEWMDTIASAKVSERFGIGRSFGFAYVWIGVG